MLDNNIKNQLKSHFESLTQPVELLIALDDSKKSTEVESLANDLASLSDKFSVSNNPDTSARRPSMVVHSPQKNTHITFAGVPMGHEFTSLVLALLHTGGHPSKASQEDIEQIQTLEKTLNFEVYISLSCQTCPQVVQALNTMAATKSNIKATMIDGALFQDEVEQRNILAVPAVYLNGEPFSQGAMSLTDILNKVDSKGAQRQAKALNEKSVFDVLVVGGGPAGASAAIYSARKGLNTGVVADRFGGQVADTLAIENFISVKATEGPKMVAQLEEHVKEYDVDVMHNQRAANLQKGSNGYDITLENGAVLQAKSLVLATGARWREMNVPGEQQYKGHGVAYCPHCDGPLFKGKPVAVIGGGNSGIEAAIDLANIVAEEWARFNHYVASIAATDEWILATSPPGSCYGIWSKATGKLVELSALPDASGVVTYGKEFRVSSGAGKVVEQRPTTHKSASFSGVQWDNHWSKIV